MHVETQPRTVLVTGGLGFIGSSLIRHLIEHTPDRIINLDKCTYAANPDAVRWVRHNPRYHFVRADINDRAALRSLLDAHRPDAVIHLAAESHVDRSIDGPGAFIETNILGTYALLEECLAYWRKLAPEAADRFRFHQVSTDEVYGSLGARGAFRETTAYAPSSPYAASKAGADHLARAWRTTYGLPVVVTNCSNNYGPHQFPEKLIPLMITKALEGERLPVYGTGDNTRDWLYVDDHSAALDLVSRRGMPGETYNIGGGAQRTNLEVVQRICDLVDEMAPPLPDRAARRSLISFVPDRPGHDQRYAIDCTKIRETLGWAPRESFEGGLRKTVRWYLVNRAWWRRIRRERYDGARLGAAATT